MIQSALLHKSLEERNKNFKKVGSYNPIFSILWKSFSVISSSAFSLPRQVWSLGSSKLTHISLSNSAKRYWTSFRTYSGQCCSLVSITDSMWKCITASPWCANNKVITKQKMAQKLNQLHKCWLQRPTVLVWNTQHGPVSIPSRR
jgi:hypothetical protein